MGQNTSDPIANEKQIDAGQTLGGIKPILAAKPIGMYTIAYKLQNPDKKTVASIKYSPEPATSKTYFVMAYNYDSTSDLITSNPINYPYVVNEKYNFEGWAYTDSLNTTPVIIKQMINFDANASPKKDEWNEGKLKETSAVRNTNVEVVGSWTTPVTIKVTYPSYSEYKELKTAVNQNPYNTVEPIKDADNKYSVKFTLPTVEKTTAFMSEIKFTIYDPYKDNEPLYTSGVTADPVVLNGITEEADVNADDDKGAEAGKTITGGKSLIWNVSEFLAEPGNHGDIYRLNISYKYAKHKDVVGTDPKTDYLAPVLIDGNFYIKISK